ncbi:type IX secretion system membrane protein PorP/SprF [Psychroserpens sp.]|uniref:PorP/SprF family type IX secretion system membrane protein n=1 Tax=Psychroserpens sp. TaxID=2020870 RepID=UPI001B1BD5B4|nr:type IX secretion system membrane protein PorP/SprF [Psychroserpens sp.]MBO6608068.1 type IX secretion system membrane protein PorP/SprF [Psychroserpens sp.]MBO6632196.1 type IX secretion system membrane protein PorP/SprF [Psychroserpens sp.]MBO6655231.1 type IX secretion system membrane protein PorP/SprF [Psychroserpens sp.]MBO6683293.1 type IX secretion system membrane protein PorP/SprF [Psychroserpens sp.]MBO6751441.1 type IX secretion system membrane protein PorP/SprF [Psychroserpens sp
MKKFYIIIVLLIATQVYGQQDPQYTQYMYNMNVINPAYAGSRENLSFGLLYRSQWAGLDGAPKTGTFFGHLPVGEKVGLGLSIISDEVGPIRETNAYADFSYTLNLGGAHKLAFGVKAGATFHDIGLAGLALIDPNDPFFQNINTTTPNIGAGFFYYTDNYYLAASVPNILNSVHLDANGNKLGSEESHYFITGGYVFQLSENTKLKPSFLVKSSFDAPTSFDVNLNALFFEKLEIGGSYRLDDSFSGLINFAVTPTVRIGYAYDAVTSDIKEYAPASHEFMLLFDLNFPRKVSRSPRFF